MTSPSMTMQAGDRLVDVAEVGSDALSGFEARSDAEREAFLADYQDIRRTRIAINLRLNGTRFAIATTVRNQSGQAVASITLVGPTADLQPRVEELAQTLLRQLDSWPPRVLTPREAI